MHTPFDPAARRIAAILSAAALCWAVALPIVPCVLAAPPSTLVQVSAWVPYAIGSLVCHQQPDRSFASAGVSWPVCGRCAGLYLSAAAGVLAVIAAPRLRRHPSASFGWWRAALILAALPTVVSWAAERAGWWMQTSTTRALLALPLGLMLGALVAAVAQRRPPEVPEHLG